MSRCALLKAGAIPALVSGLLACSAGEVRPDDMSVISTGGQKSTGGASATGGSGGGSATSGGTASGGGSSSVGGTGTATGGTTTSGGSGSGGIAATGGASGGTATSGPYPEGPYADQDPDVGGVIENLMFRGYVNPSGTGLATDQPLVDTSMAELRDGGPRYLLIHIGAVW